MNKLNCDICDKSMSNDDAFVGTHGGCYCQECVESEKWGDMISCALDDGPDLAWEGRQSISITIELERAA